MAYGLQQWASEEIEKVRGRFVFRTVKGEVQSALHPSKRTLEDKGYKVISQTSEFGEMMFLGVKTETGETNGNE